MSELRPALVVLALLTLLTGVAYPLLVTGVAQAAFPAQANGSLLEQGNKVVGSSLIGQEFEDPKYFWGRLSATTPAYNPASSSGSNLGPLNPALVAEVKGRVDALRAADPGNTAPIPVDLVTSSASGLDPHISPAAAYFQVARVAKARGVDAARVKALVDARIEGRALGVLGEPVVNVLLLNLALDKL
ncbi:MAG TPA: potassium-transporting ATPase subunit KdpC [Polyangiaceae bacterium]|nr:potassium-transporting ATPase subunit KdpC [Polyangiaceae bacterium]